MSGESQRVFCKESDHVSLVSLLILGTCITLEKEMYHLKPNLTEI